METAEPAKTNTYVEINIKSKFYHGALVPNRKRSPLQQLDVMGIELLA